MDICNKPSPWYDGIELSQENCDEMEEYSQFNSPLLG